MQHNDWNNSWISSLMLQSHPSRFQVRIKSIQFRVNPPFSHWYTINMTDVIQSPVYRYTWFVEQCLGSSIPCQQIVTLFPLSIHISGLEMMILNRRKRGTTIQLLGLWWKWGGKLPLVKTQQPANAQLAFLACPCSQLLIHLPRLLVSSCNTNKFEFSIGPTSHCKCPHQMQGSER